MSGTAHWIQPITTTRVPTHHIALDCEAHRHPGRAGERQTWRLAVTSADHRPDGAHPWSQTVWGRHSAPEDLWRWVTEQCGRGRRTVLVAHNLGYDLRISQAFTWLPELGWTLEHLSMGPRTASMTWRNDHGTLVMTDTMAWLPVPLAQIGMLLGLEKPDLPDEDDSESAWWERCEADVRILRAAWLHLVEWIERDDLGSWRASGAGQAWNHWRHRHYTHRVLAHTVPDVRAAERESIYAGRCEAWRWGDCGRGPFDEWDHSLAYARVAAEIDVPTRWRHARHSGSVSAWRRDRERHELLTLVDVDTDVPVVPTLHGDRRLWPVGRFTSWLWPCEIDLLDEVGARWRPRMWHCYRAEPALRSWAEWAIDMIDGPGAHERPLERLAVKHWTRALPGRFAARYADWEPFGPALRGDGTLTLCRDMDDGRRYKRLDLPSGMIAEGELHDIPDSAPAILSRIMAQCRVNLWRAMCTAGLETLAYVDTDGLICDPAGSARLETARIPGLRRKTRYKALRVFGPRQFVADGSLKAAGIPRGAVYMGGGQWGGEVWESLPTSLGTGHPGEVWIRPRTWKLAGVDVRRQHRPDGTTEPYVLDQGE